MSARRLLPFLALLLLALPSAALAAVPQYITYSGRILDEFGEAVEGEVVLEVAIFQDPVDPTDPDELGTMSWSDEFTTIVINGYFSVILGSNAVLDADALAGDDVYVALSIDSGPYLVPASRLTSAPFALNAEKAESASQADVASSVVGPVDATVVEIDGEQVIDANGNWTGSIETTRAAKVGSLWVDGVLIIDNSNWVGPAPDLPAGTAIDGEPVLTGTDLEDQVDTQIATFVGTEQDTNPLNHERYQGRDELLMEIENVGSVTALPSYAEEYLYHAPTTAADVVADLQDDFVSTAGDTMSGDLTVDGTVKSRGINDENDPTGVTPGSVAFSLAPDPAGASTANIQTWEIEATEDAFVVKDFQGSATEYLVIEESAAGVGLISLQPEGNASVVVGASSVDIAPAGSSGSAVTTAAQFSQSAANLVNTSTGPSLQVTQGAVTVPLNTGASMMTLTPSAVTIGQTGITTTVNGDLAVLGSVNLTSQNIQGTLAVDADVAAGDGNELYVDSDGATVTGTLDVTGQSTLAATNVVGATDLTGDVTVSNGASDVMTVTSSQIDMTLPVTIDAGNNGDEVSVTNGQVSVEAVLLVDAPSDSTVELQVLDSGVVVNDGLTVQTGGVTIDAGGLEVADGNLTVAANADNSTEVAVTDTGMDITGDLNVSGTISGTITGSVTTTAIEATAGNLTVTADGDGSPEMEITDTSVTIGASTTLSSGNLTLATGDLTLTTGDLAVTAGTMSSTGLTVAGPITSTTGNMVVGANGDGVASLTADDSGVTILDGLTVSTGDTTVTAGDLIVTAGELQVADGNLRVAADADLADVVVIAEDGMDITGDLDVTGVITGTINGTVNTTAITSTQGNLIVDADNNATTEVTINDGLVTVAAPVTVSTGDVTLSAGSLDASGSLTAGTGVNVTSGGVAVTAGGVNVTAGSVTAGGGLAVSGGNLTVTAGTMGVDVDADFDADNDNSFELAVNDNSVDVIASLNVTGDTTLSGGSSDLFVGGNIYGSSTGAAADFGAGIDVASGGIDVTAGGVDVTSGGVSVTAGGVAVTAGGVTVTAGDVSLGSGKLTRSGCPSGFQAINGSSNFCASTSTQGPSTWVNANAACYSAASHVCTTWELIYIDQTTASYSELDGSPADDEQYWCGLATDGGSKGNDVGSFDPSPSGADENDDIDNVSLNGTQSRHYLCCITP